MIFYDNFCLLDLEHVSVLTKLSCFCLSDNTSTLYHICQSFFFQPPLHDLTLLTTHTASRTRFLGQRSSPKPLVVSETNNPLLVSSLRPSQLWFLLSIISYFLDQILLQSQQAMLAWLREVEKEFAAFVVLKEFILTSKLNNIQAIRNKLFIIVSETGRSHY